MIQSCAADQLAVVCVVPLTCGAKNLTPPTTDRGKGDGSFISL